MYSYTYHETESELFNLESKYVFNREEKNKLLISDLKVEPSCIAFIKTSIDIILISDDYPSLIGEINDKYICTVGAKLNTRYSLVTRRGMLERLDVLLGVSYSIYGSPDCHNPPIAFAI